MCFLEILWRYCFGGPSPKKRQVITSKVRKDVWTNYFPSSDQGQCYCCGIPVNRYNNGWHCAHVLADCRGGEPVVGNLRVTCAHCNLAMGDQNLYAYIDQHRLHGPGEKNKRTYFARHPSQRGNLRTNNWKKEKKRVSWI